MSEPMPIPAVTKLVAECWLKAEANARAMLEDCYPDKDEEFITEFFHGQFRRALKEENSRASFAEAFASDVTSTFPSVDPYEVEEVAASIGAETTFHNRKTEGVSGGDFGIVFIRPNATVTPSALQLEADYRRGLLCQAKIKRRPSLSKKSKWAGFTDNQLKMLPGRLSYLSLVLYEYNDSERHALNPFLWQLCDGATLAEAEQWLKLDRFPRRQPSGEIISLLGNATIGTDDNTAIEEYVGPKMRDSLTIRIGWPQGGGPPPGCELQFSPEQEEDEGLCVLQQR